MSKRPERQTEPQQAGHTHAEAFCRMQYRDEVTGEIEWIWNSRDGVTPFSIPSRQGNEARHVSWHEDRYLPHFVPQVGSRIFVDMTEGRAREINQKNVERWWAENAAGIRTRYESEAAAVEALMSGWGHRWTDESGVEHFHPGPDVVEVTREVLTDVLGYELQTCPRRMGEPGPWAREKDLDVWRELPNGDRTCSFCGSLHPEDFERLCDEAADPTSDVRLDHSDKPYKVYVQQSGVQNAAEGGIKYYKQHSPIDAEWLDRMQPKFEAALSASQGKFADWLQGVKSRYAAGKTRA